MKPLAACPLDESVPTDTSAAQPREAAPLFSRTTLDEARPLLIAHHYAAARIPNARYIFGAAIEGQIKATILISGSSARWENTNMVELVRLVRSPDYPFPLSAFLAWAIRQVKKDHDLLITYADPAHGHHGGVYQASGFFYAGQGTIEPPGRPEKKNHFQSLIDGFFIDGIFTPRRSCNARYGTSSYPKLQALLSECLIIPHRTVNKHLYWRPLRISGRAKAKKLGLKKLSFPKPRGQAEL